MNATAATPAGPWWKQLNRYHWFVLVVATLGWVFDCLDQQLFTLARPTAMRDLLAVPAGDPAIAEWGGYVTSIFIIGWATGGLVFGALGDRIGRAKTMVITILVYSLCTGLSAASTSVWDFSAYRFLTGLGVGGEFAVGVALVAEVMPDAARPRALSLLQALSTVGNVSAAAIGWSLASFEAEGLAAWRVMFLIGAIPAVLALVIRSRLKEPARWREVADEASARGKAGSYAALFGDPRWRRNAFVGLGLAIPGVVGLWGIGFFAGDLTRTVFRREIAAEVAAELREEAADDATRLATIEKVAGWEEAMTPKEGRSLEATEEPLAAAFADRVSGRLTRWQSLTLVCQQIGGFLGMYGFGWLAERIGRRASFLIAFIAAMATTALVFASLASPWDFWMIVLMGFFQFSLFAGYAVYFPEIFPTRLRSTGTSFCYNVGRYVAAFGPLLFGLLTSRVFTGPGYPTPLNWRYAGISMSAVFLVGIVALAFAPETRGRPLPEG